MKKVVIFCDYDGTIIENDGCDLIMERYGSINWDESGKKYLAKKIYHSEMNESFAENLVANRSELVSLLNEGIVIRRGFQNFYHALTVNNIVFVVISAGWELYISEVLKNINFRFIEDPEMLADHIQSKRLEIPLITNRIVNSKSESKWKIVSPWLKHTCQKSTPCKGLILDSIKKLGYYTIAIGNSATDMCMAEKADYVFATGSLVGTLKKSSIRHKEFVSFDEITNQILSIVNDLSKQV